jgi:hypothetical protein
VWHSTCLANARPQVQPVLQKKQNFKTTVWKAGDKRSLADMAQVAEYLPSNHGPLHSKLQYLPGASGYLTEIGRT